MSLDWDISDCKAGQASNDVERSWLDALIWGSITIDIGKITDDNVNEVLFRYRFCERLGHRLVDGGMPVEAIQRWVGLRTNVFNLTRAKWLDKIAKIVKQNLAHEVDSEVKREIERQKVA